MSKEIKEGSPDKIAQIILKSIRSILHQNAEVVLDRSIGTYSLGWPLEPFEKYWYIGSLKNQLGKIVKYPKGQPYSGPCSMSGKCHPRSKLAGRRLEK